MCLDGSLLLCLCVCLAGCWLIAFVCLPVGWLTLFLRACRLLVGCLLIFLPVWLVGSVLVCLGLCLAGRSTVSLFLCVSD